LPKEEECDATECLKFLKKYEETPDYKFAAKKCKKVSSSMVVIKKCKVVVKDVLKRGLEPKERCEIRKWCSFVPARGPTSAPTKSKVEEECDATTCLKFLGKYEGASDFKSAAKKCKKVSSLKAVQKNCKQVVKDVLINGLIPRKRCEIRKWCS